MRLAGTLKKYSKKSIIQLITITLNRGTLRYLRWPYQAKVMKMLEKVSSAIVLMDGYSSFRQANCGFTMMLVNVADKFPQLTSPAPFSLPGAAILMLFPRFPFTISFRYLSPINVP